MAIYSVGFLVDDIMIKAFAVATESEDEAEELVKEQIADTPDRMFLDDHYEIVVEEIK